MITPPIATPSFYSVLLEPAAAQFIIGLVAPSFSDRDDVVQAMVISKDFDSDIAANHELQTGALEICDNLTDEGAEAEIITKYNPLFLPMEKDELFECLEVDDDGEVIAVDGFKNPYISMMMSIGIEEHPTLIDGKVLYKHFAIPPLHESMEHYERH